MMREVLATMHPWLKAVLFLSLFFIMIFFAQIISMIILNLTMGVSFEAFEAFMRDFQNPDTRKAMMISQNIYQLVGFLGASIAFAIIFTWNSVNRFWLFKKHWLIFLAPLCMLAANPIIEWLIAFNEWLIPEGSQLEAIFKPMEEQASEITSALLVMNNSSDLFRNILVVAVVPSICEELVFRGVFQSQIAKATRNVHIGIWLAAFLFSAIHLQFYGFFPRLFLGAFFGYLLIWTGSMWAPILAHFTNNCTTLLVEYYYQSTPDMEGVIEEQVAMNIPAVLLTLGLAGLVFLYIKKGVWLTIKQKYLWWKKPGDSILGDHRMN